MTTNTERISYLLEDLQIGENGTIKSPEVIFTVGKRDLFDDTVIIFGESAINCNIWGCEFNNYMDMAKEIVKIVKSYHEDIEDFTLDMCDFWIDKE